MNIPKSVVLSGITYKIIFVDVCSVDKDDEDMYDIDEETGKKVFDTFKLHDACTDFRTCTIELRKGIGGQYQEQSLTHELEHIKLYHCGLGDLLTEQQVEALAFMNYEAIRYNPKLFGEG